MSLSVGVLGKGLLADLIFEPLSKKYSVFRVKEVHQIPKETDLVLVLDDTWNPMVYVQAEEALSALKIPWLRGLVYFGEGIIGPLVRPGIKGCSQCADERRIMAGLDRREMWEMYEQYLVKENLFRDVWASRTGLWQMAQIMMAKIDQILAGDFSTLENQMIFIHLKTLKVSRHSFLPNPLCPICAQLPEDSPEMAQIVLQSSPKVAPDQFRFRSLDELRDVLEKDYLDQRTGLLNQKRRDFITPFADASVNLPLVEGDEGAGGRTHVYPDSELTAILEGLERYCGVMPRGKRTVVHDCFNNLRKIALDPAKVGLHFKEQYQRPNFPFQPFDPNQPIDWVWGYSFLQERPILVPQKLAYYSLGDEAGFVYETSNGCALGGSLEEAIFYGIMEVVERDAFLLTWYAQLPLPRLDPKSADDPELSLMIERIKAVAQYDIFLFNATMEHGIPSIWAIAKNRREKGLNLICAAGAHLDPVRAAKNAIHELAGMMLILDEPFEANKEKYMKMLEDPYLVREMDDHSMLYGLKEAEERLHFLLQQDGPMRSFQEEFTWKKVHPDLTGDLKEILQVFKQLNLEVIVVDQTAPELAKNGLFCVKVIIPGMLPMTFGYHLTRLDGLKRVLHVPRQLGYVNEPLTINQLNPHPHPFP